MEQFDMGWIFQREIFQKYHLISSFLPRIFIFNSYWSENIICHWGQPRPHSCLMNLEINRKVSSFPSLFLWLISTSMYVYTSLIKALELFCSDEITLLSWVSGGLLVCFFLPKLIAQQHFQSTYCIAWCILLVIWSRRRLENGSV